MDVTSLVAWTLLHFVWQGALIGLAALVALKALRGGAASTRYIVGVVALSLMAGVPVITMSRLQYTVIASVAEPADPEISDLSAATPTLAGQAGDTRPSASGGVGGSRGGGSSAATKNVRAEATSSVSMISSIAGSTRVRAWVDATAPYVVRMWLLGVLIFSLRLLSGWLGVRRLITVGVQAPAALLRDRFDGVRDTVRTSRAVRLLESAIVQTPAVVGFFKPVLLWPISLQTGLTVPQIDLLLAHELAHLKRHDYLVNLMQTLLETALFYHPAVWWLSKRVREERELCCDDIALTVAGDRRDYAEALLALESWRHPLPVLVAGATGGSLLHRVKRLLTADPHRAADRPRWAALPLAAAALAGILVSAHEAPARTVATESWSSPMLKQSRVPMGPAKPSSVTKYEGTGALESRLAWATKEASARGFSKYWLGYAIAADPARSFLYIDRFTPVTSDNGSFMMGHLRFKRAEQLTIPGVPLAEVVGSRSEVESVIFLGFDAGKPGVVERVHVSSSMLPVHLAGLPLLWLDHAPDAESIGLIRGVYDRALSEDLRTDLVAATGAHISGALVFAAMRSWVESPAPDHVRVSAVEEIGELDVKGSVAFLDQTARNDRSREVRREAAEALGEQPSIEATKVLGALARTANDREVAREAAESLGERKDPEAIDELVSLVWSDIAIDTRREAVESLGESAAPRNVRELEKIARTHPVDDLRREALGSLAEHKDSESAVSVLESAAREDRSESVRSEALDALTEMSTTRAMRVVADIAETSPDAEMRKKSIESLWENGQKESALQSVRSMVKSNDLRTARAGIEILSDLDTPESVALLATLARTDNRLEVERAAVESLGNANATTGSLEALRDIVASHPREEVQRAAVEAMGNISSTAVPAELARIARTHPSEQVQVTAVESLDRDAKDAVPMLQGLVTDAASDRVKEAAIEALIARGPSKEQAEWLAAGLMKDGSSRKVQMAILDGFEEMGTQGIELVIAASRNSKDREVRQRAIEILAESSDPRAKKELVRIIEK